MPITLVIEDGLVITGANSFVSLDDFQTYCDDRGMDYSAYTDDQQEAALIRSAQYLNDLRWKGVKTGRDNPMAWPRYGTEVGGSMWNQLEFPASTWVGVLDRDGFYVGTSEVPAEVVKAQCEAAFLILTGSTLEPSLDRGGAVKREKVDVIETEYFPGAPGETTFKPIINRLMGLLKSGSTIETVRA